MIYTEDSLSDHSRNAIRSASVEDIMRKQKQQRLMNVGTWTVIFIIVLTTSTLAIIGRETGWMWGWPIVLMFVAIDSNRKFENEMDIMKISLDPEILDSIKNKKCNCSGRSVARLTF